MKLKVYFDFRDWWIGYYRGGEHHFVCLVPTVVIRWKRKFKLIKSVTPINPVISRMLDEAYHDRLTKLLENDSNFIQVLNKLDPTGPVTFPIRTKKSDPPVNP